MTKERIKTVALITSIVLAIVCAIGWIVQAADRSAVRKSTNAKIIRSEQTEPVLGLSAVRSGEADSADTYILTATVYPHDAENKAVDWEIAWKSGTPLETEPVTDYVTVTPSFDGALTATVKCVKQFYGSTAIVTVTTREGGFTSSAVVGFDGAPTELAVNGGEAATQKITDECVYSVHMDNVFRYVGDHYADELIVESVAVGGTYTSCSLNGNKTTGEFTRTDIKENESVAQLKGTEDRTFADFLSVTANSDGITVTYTERLQSLSQGYEEQGNYFRILGVFYSDLNAYADITVKCNGFVAVFRVNLISGVYGVSLDMPNIEF